MNPDVSVLRDQGHKSSLKSSLYLQLLARTRNKLTFTTFWANSADDKRIFSSFFFSPENRPSHFMQMRQFAEKVKFYFSGKNKKNISECLLLILLHSMLSINTFYLISYLVSTLRYLVGSYRNFECTYWNLAALINGILRVPTVILQVLTGICI